MRVQYMHVRLLSAYKGLKLASISSCLIPAFLSLLSAYKGLKHEAKAIFTGNESLVY